VAQEVFMPGCLMPVKNSIRPEKLK